MAEPRNENPNTGEGRGQGGSPAKEALSTAQMLLWAEADVRTRTLGLIRREKEDPVWFPGVLQ